MKAAIIKKYYFSKSLFPFLSAVLTGLIAVEWLARQSVAEILKWIIEQPAPFALNIFLVAVFFAAIVGLTGRMALGLFMGFLTLLLFGTVNMLKLSILQNPFLAWDFLYIKQMGALGAATFSKQMIFSAAVIGLLIIGFFVYLFKKKKSLLRIRSRVFLMFAAFVLIALFWRAAADPLKYFRIENIIWNQSQNYFQNGSILSFSMNISPLLLSKPKGYARDLVYRLTEHNQKPDMKNGSGDRPVSLIVFMSESFSDLAGTLDETPGNYLAHFKELSSRFPDFQMISPTYAGNTSLVEFEVLTGLSNAFLPSGAIPFDHYLHRPTPSLAWILKKNGYQTVAIHPFHAWFWNRNVVYPNLGFDQFISIDQFDPEAKKGLYTSDEALVDKIIEVADASEGPFFIHAVSMENHGPYMPGRYGDENVHFNQPLSEGLRYEMESFLTGLRDADRQLARLLRYLESLDRPVICLFFGDHQPSFSMAVYDELGRSREGIEKELQIYTVPGLIWSNHEKSVDQAVIPEQLSPAYLPAVLLQQMAIPLPDYMRYLLKGLSGYPVVHRNFVVDASGNIIRFKDQRSAPYLRGLEVLNFDVLFGAGFSWPL